MPRGGTLPSRACPFASRPPPSPPLEPAAVTPTPGHSSGQGGPRRRHGDRPRGRILRGVGGWHSGVSLSHLDHWLLAICPIRNSHFFVMGILAIKPFDCNDPSASKSDC